MVAFACFRSLKIVTGEHVKLTSNSAIYGDAVILQALPAFLPLLGKFLLIEDMVKWLQR